MSSARTALVTGGLGFVGAALSRALLDSGTAVRVLDDGSRGHARRLGAQHGDVEVVEADVRDREAVRRAVHGADEVWHLAAVNGTRHFYEAPAEVFEVAVRGTLNVLDAAHQAGVQRVILASSSEVYADPAVVPTPEDIPLTVPRRDNPRFSYGGSKIVGELMGLYLGTHRGLEVVTVRPHNVYGPDMGHDHVIPELTVRLAKAMHSELDTATPDAVTLDVEGDGTETRAFCFIDDAAAGMLQVGRTAPAGEVVHIGTQVETSIASLAQAIAETLGTRVELQTSPRREGSPRRRCPDISKARGLGWEPRVGLIEGLEKTIPFYLRASSEEGT